jgi:hypothetical protein
VIVDQVPIFPSRIVADKQSLTPVATKLQLLPDFLFFQCSLKYLAAFPGRFRFFLLPSLPFPRCHTKLLDRRKIVRLEPKTYHGPAQNAARSPIAKYICSLEDQSSTQTNDKSCEESAVFVLAQEAMLSKVDFCWSLGGTGSYRKRPPAGRNSLTGCLWMPSGENWVQRFEKCRRDRRLVRQSLRPQRWETSLLGRKL